MCIAWAELWCEVSLLRRGRDCGDGGDQLGGVAELTRACVSG
jgi:hypothetical protein